MQKLIVWAVLILGGGYLGAKLYLHHSVREDLDAMLLAVSPMARIEYSGISSTMGGTLSVEGIRATVNGYRDPIVADRVSLITPGFLDLLRLGDLGSKLAANEVPGSLALEVIGLSTTADSDLMRMLHSLSAEQDTTAERNPAAECTGQYGYSPDMLQRLGYRQLAVDLRIGYREDRGNLVVGVRTAVKEMYDMQLELSFAGGFSPVSMASGTYQPRLVDGRVEYIDRSLDARTSRLCAEAGLSPEEVFTAKLDAFNAFGADSGIVFDEQITEPFKEFLGGKSTFVLTAKPTEPVNLAQIGLYNPSDVPALLNLTAAALP